MVAPRKPQSRQREKSQEVHIELAGPSHFRDIAKEDREQSEPVIGHHDRRVDDDQRKNEDQENSKCSHRASPGHRRGPRGGASVESSELRKISSAPALAETGAGIVLNSQCSA